MAREVHNRDISPTLSAAEAWIRACLIQDGSLFSDAPLWGDAEIEEVHRAFVEHPDFGKDDFMTKLSGQMKFASASAQQLMAELLWALLLFPSNMKAETKRRQVEEIWELSGDKLPAGSNLISDEVLDGIGSGGPGFNNYRPNEMTFLIALARSLKSLAPDQRERVLTNYEAFIDWINSVPMEGNRQFRHMLRYFAFPDRVERISSDNDRRKILEGFDVAPHRLTKGWSDKKLDEALAELRAKLVPEYPGMLFDFYAPDLKKRWAPDRTIKTVEGEIAVTVPGEDDEEEEPVDGSIENPASGVKAVVARQSFQIQAKLVEIGIAMGFKVWLPRSDRNRVCELIADVDETKLLDDLPLNYDQTTLATIEQIDVLWIKRQSIVRAFEVEHSTAVFSGLLRMADLLALQPNMDIRLHIVAPEERREKVFREMLRPVFVLLERGPLSRSCTFISYKSVN